MTVVVVMGNVEPEAGEQIGVITPSTTSFAETEKLTTAPEALVACAMMLAGTIREGGVVSTTCSIKLVCTA